MGEYSLEMSEDVIEVQKWVHEFAENVVRPAAHEWDEKEATPWPIIQEAAKNGLYSLEFYAQQYAAAEPLEVTIVHLQIPGSLESTDQVLTGATGDRLGTAAFKAHLESRYLSA